MSEDLPTFERPTTAISGVRPRRKLFWTDATSDKLGLQNFHETSDESGRAAPIASCLHTQSSMRKSTKRRRNRLFLVLLACLALPAAVLGLLWLITLPDVAALRTTNPATTALIDARAATGGSQRDCA